MRKDQDEEIVRLEFSRDRRRLAAVDAGRRVVVFDTNGGQTVCEIVLPEVVHDVALSPDGGMLATAGAVVTVWDAATGALSGQTLGEIHSSIGPYPVIGISPHGTLVAEANTEFHVKIVDLATRKTRALLPGTSPGFLDRITSVSFSRNGRHLAAGGRDGTLYIFDMDPSRDGLNGPQLRTALQAQSDEIRGTAFDPQQTWIASVSARDFVVWDQSDGTPELGIAWGALRSWTPDLKRRVRFNPRLENRAEVWDRESNRTWPLEHSSEFQTRGYVLSRDGQHVVALVRGDRVPASLEA